MTEHPADETAAPKPRRKRRWLRWTLLVVLVAAAGTGAAWYLNDQIDTADPDTAAVFNTDLIEVRDLAEKTSISGTLAYDDALVVDTPISGVVAHIPADGAILERGDRLFAVDSMVTDSQLTAAEQRIASAQASLANAEIALEDLESSAAAAELASAEAAVAQARLTLDRLLTDPTEAEFGAAEAAFARAQEAYDDLLADPDPTVLPRPSQQFNKQSNDSVPPGQRGICRVSPWRSPGKNTATGPTGRSRLFAGVCRR